MLLFHQQPTQQYTERYRSNKWRKPIQLLRRFTAIFFIILFIFFSSSFLRIYRVQRPQSHFQKVGVLTEDENWKNLHEPFRDKHYPKSQRCAIQESMNAHGFSSNKTSQLPTQNFAFVFGGLGAYAKLEAFKCLLAVESLVKVGGYKGDVYFITEPKACVPTQIELRKLLNYDKVYVLSKDDESKLSGESSFSNRRIKKKKKISTYLKDMSVKMDIFQFLPERIQIAAWYDCDVVFGVQDCVKNNLLCDIPAFSSKVPMYNSAGWHLGSFMVHRKYSRDLYECGRKNCLRVNTNPIILLFEQFMSAKRIKTPNIVGALENSRMKKLETRTAQTMKFLPAIQLAGKCIQVGETFFGIRILQIRA